ncbi:hypothetical protein L207DRAFT_259827 [Hyaloscypha variabilis F]|uniref:Uncharacterized protein n=1 Tax=Hyaloscypha variabilis (strain UAMH 11265 / GT02V1 / F) TaxID=1149755 RepID=A0A2J6S4U5_HYAVF|nr:hypothetical protein L207DRAFT_259827 [Hyaloscypha variabilis F]
MMLRGKGRGKRKGNFSCGGDYNDFAKTKFWKLACEKSQNSFSSQDPRLLGCHKPLHASVTWPRYQHSNHFDPAWHCNTKTSWKSPSSSFSFLHSIIWSCAGLGTWASELQTICSTPQISSRAVQLLGHSRFHRVSGHLKIGAAGKIQYTWLNVWIGAGTFGGYRSVMI